VTFDLVLVGFGHVARRFVELLAERRAILQRDFGVTTRVVAVATRQHGRAQAARGLDVAGLSRAVVRGDRIGPGDGEGTAGFVASAVRRHRAAAQAGRLVVVEATTLDIARGEPAITHVRSALDGGAHVITTNKGPAAFAYRALARAANRANRRFLFEGAVMDGIPVFNLVRETLPAVRIAGFRGVVNSTTNFILTAMEQGQPFEEALTEMRAMGVAEADASLDVDGWDAAAKTAALANVLLRASMTPHDVERQGISAAAGRRAVEARASGRRLKLVARAGRESGRWAARVAPEELAEDDLLAGLEGQQNAIIFHTDLLEEFAIVQRSGSLTQTAYALLSDLVTIATHATSRPPPRARPRRTL
jgi:homoserine dehydrogenase